MALSITFDGYAYDSNSVLSSGDIYYQAFFYSSGTASSASTWNTLRSVEGSGYYNVNLGDNDWLGQEGTALAGARVLIVFWKGSSDRLSDCTLLTEWCNIEIVLTGADVYSTNIQTMPNISPTLDWATNVGSHPYARTSYYFSNDSDDEHSWDFNGTNMYHTYEKYGQTFFSVNSVVETNFDWGDNEVTLALEGASDGAHTWSAAGDYTVTMDIEDACGATATGTVDIRVYWRPPVPTLSRCDSAGNELSSVVSDPDTPIYFKYTGTNDDDVIVSILWTIEDEGDYGNTTTVVSGSATDIVGHSEGLGTDWLNHTATPLAFTNPGAHTVTTTITWFDGFENQTLTYSNTITQNKFAGPYVSFTQDPVAPEVWEPLTLTNTTTNTDRVGLGLPDGNLYTWTWYDGESEVTQTDVAYEYELVQTPQTANCHATLCAEWSDGFESMTTCVTRDIVFKTSISVTLEDCYYILKVVGTSSDGTATDYSWTISSGTYNTGPWYPVWESPVGLDQQDKTLCFTAIGWYKIEGFVHGSGDTTSAYDTMYVSEVCPEDGPRVTLPIWDGTGVLDVGSDWVREGFGNEAVAAKYEGTNGLRVQNAASDDFVRFHTIGYGAEEIDEYDFLAFWINIRKWTKGSDATVDLYLSSNQTSTPLSLSNYIRFNKVKEWQRVMIPLPRFELPQSSTVNGLRTFVDTLEFSSIDGIDFWFDNARLTAGGTVTIAVTGTDQQTFGLDTGADNTAMITSTVKLPTPSVGGQTTTIKSAPTPIPRSIAPISRSITPGSRTASRPTINPFPNPKDI
jgi:hypothetical protein